MTSTSTDPITPIKIGIVSDTHGYLPDWVKVVFENAQLDHVMHVGDFGHENILWDLGLIASPVIAVRGNCDFQAALLNLPATKRPVIGNTQLIISHKPNEINASLRRIRRSEINAPFVLGIHGHTHVPRSEQINADTYILCPGSPSEPREGSKHSIAILTIAPEGSDVAPTAQFINPAD